jgi:hypothetical protein
MSFGSGGVPPLGPLGPKSFQIKENKGSPRNELVYQEKTLEMSFGSGGVPPLGPLGPKGFQIKENNKKKIHISYI